MNQKLKRMVEQYMKNLTAEDISRFSAQNNINLSASEADKIKNYFHQTNLDPFNASDRDIFFRDLAVITNQRLATKAKETFYAIIHAYHLEHLL